MSDDQQGRDKSTDLAEERTSLAVMRTVAAADRTLMAWVRTSISMIGFGFTIYKFLQYLREGERVIVAHREAPRNFGLALIALGTLTLIGAILQHRSFLKRIGAAQREHLWGLTMIVSILVVLIGILAFIGILLRTGPF